MKKLISCFLSVLLLISGALPALAAEGDPKPGLTSSHVVYISGSNDMVRPDQPLSRAEAASIVYPLLDMTFPAEETGQFSDVPQGAWFQPQVDFLTELGILHGYTDGTFRPERQISRAEFVTLLARFYPDEEPGEASFTDVDPTHWAYPQIAVASAKGWVTGYGDGSFRPDALVTRAEAITMTNRVLGRCADRAYLDARKKVLRFLDLPMDHWAYYDIMEASLPHTPDFSEGEEVWLDHSIPETSREDGPHWIDGSLYLCEYGHWVHDETVGVLTFGPDGRYTTGDSQLDSALRDIVRSQGGIVAGDLESLKKLYDHTIHGYSYRGASILEEGTEGWEPEIALEMATVKKGNCYRYTALFVMLARQCGFQAKGVAGQVNFNTGYGWGPHSWAEIDLDGQTWLCDPDVEMAYPRMDMFMRAFGDVEPSYRLFDEMRG